MFNQHRECNWKCRCTTIPD